MIEKPSPSGDWTDDTLTAADAAAYVYQIAGEIASMAHKAGLIHVATALWLAKDLAAEKLAEPRPAPQADP